MPLAPEESARRHAPRPVRPGPVPRPETSGSCPPRARQTEWRGVADSFTDLRHRKKDLTRPEALSRLHPTSSNPRIIPLNVSTSEASKLEIARRNFGPNR
jgi:hypothetical protein